MVPDLAADGEGLERIGHGLVLDQVRHVVPVQRALQRRQPLPKKILKTKWKKNARYLRIHLWTQFQDCWIVVPQRPQTQSSATLVVFNWALPRLDGFYCFFLLDLMSLNGFLLDFIGFY